jgi:hypothetical protein
MLANITYFMIFGKPLIMYLGILTLLSLLGTAIIGFLLMKGKMKPPFITIKTHRLMACLTISLALIHGILGILMYF